MEEERWFIPNRISVLVFVHGGAWASGRKEHYSFLGRNFVRAGLVTVIINYNLSPNPIERMAQDCTAAVLWVYENISLYGGNRNRIFLMGHSAGGHLIELINADNHYFTQYESRRNPIYGVILLDAFGLDMHEYLSSELAVNYPFYKTFLQVFSSDPRRWKRASPMQYRKTIRNPHLILVGEETLSVIQRQSRQLYNFLVTTRRAPVEFFEIPRRNHIGMVIRMFFSSSQQYDIILNFLRRY